ARRAPCGLFLDGRTPGPTVRGAARSRRGRVAHHQVPGLDQERLAETLALFHDVWEGVDPADVGWADTTVARGNFRTWVKITSHVYALAKRGRDIRVDRALIEQACARLGPYP
ncbi:hypothetical protein AB0953_35245, partial [Streptomyces sp. NPDC046866]|uniref:hypothetical protein n=1 Tax=Streptomyces sp. NPDC046866 TaxID=3154921 RepID=UPI003453AB0E